MLKSISNRFNKVQKVTIPSKHAILRCFGSNLSAIENALADNFEARVIEVADESASHMEAHDSHFRVYIASN